VGSKPDKPKKQTDVLWLLLAEGKNGDANRRGPIRSSADEAHRNSMRRRAENESINTLRRSSLQSLSRPVNNHSIVFPDVRAKRRSTAAPSLLSRADTPVFRLIIIHCMV